MHSGLYLIISKTHEDRLIVVIAAFRAPKIWVLSPCVAGADAAISRADYVPG
ncbi:hypothetical protein PEC301899_22610 [Pectobacterium carotovorum subsp. carotovorum]|nr:hypothetical protein PEC301899_22610 [Pectobacterium carotovorum subsp. carotovorum]